MPITRILSSTVLIVALAACEDHNVGENNPDAATDAAPIDVAIDAPIDAAACTCGPGSCGTRVCGRSACGFPCGTCEPDEFCFVGNGCTTGPGPGTPCIDAFGERAWEGDRGFRACPGDPSR